MMDNEMAVKKCFEHFGGQWLKPNPDHTRDLLSLIANYIHEGDELLDICCGHGRLTIPLIQAGYTVLGIDISEIVIDYGRILCAKSGIKSDPFVVGSMKNLPFSKESFHFSFCVWSSFNFMVTFEDQISSLNEMHRILKPNGKALIECALHEEAGSVQEISTDAVSYEYFPFTPEEFEKLGSKSLFSRTNISIEILAGRKRTVAIFEK
nr:class I SAM-dependent methyltransferase [Leptospira weilii]